MPRDKIETEWRSAVARLKTAPIKKSYLIAAVFALVVVLWVLSGQFGGGPPAPAPTAADTAANKPFRVTVTTVRAQPKIQTIEITGRTAAARRVELRAETAGRIDSIGAAEGAKIARGALVAQIALDDRRAQLAEADALLQQRDLEYRAAVELEKKGFRPATKLAENKAQLDAARAHVERVRIDVRNTTIAAPFQSILNERFVEIGDYVKVGDRIAEVVDLDPILLKGSVSEKLIDRIEIGDVASARLVDGREIAGRIRFISSVADGATRTFPIEVEVDNPDWTIPAGVTAQIKLPAAERQAHFISSAALTLSDLGAVGVKIVSPGNTARFVPVDILADQSDGTWVTGLPDTARIITVGQEFVRDGAPIEPVEAEKGDVP